MKQHEKVVIQEAQIAWHELRRWCQESQALVQEMTSDDKQELIYLCEETARRLKEVS